LGACTPCSAAAALNRTKLKKTRTSYLSGFTQVTGWQK
jgi:hypothetical protein